MDNNIFIKLLEGKKYKYTKTYLKTNKKYESFWDESSSEHFPWVTFDEMISAYNDYRWAMCRIDLFEWVDSDWKKFKPKETIEYKGLKENFLI